MYWVAQGAQQLHLVPGFLLILVQRSSAGALLSLTNMQQTHTNTRSAGTARYANGSTYTGDFERDLRVGWGRLELSNGESYEGEWAGDEFHGAHVALLVCVLCVLMGFCGAQLELGGGKDTGRETRFHGVQSLPLHCCCHVLVPWSQSAVFRHLQTPLSEFARAISQFYTGQGKYVLAGGAGHYIGAFEGGQRTRGKLVLRGGEYEYSGE